MAAGAAVGRGGGGVGSVVSGVGGGGVVVSGGGGGGVSGGGGKLVSAPGSSPPLAAALPPSPAMTETYHGCRPVAAFIHASLAQWRETQSSLTKPPDVFLSFFF